jgi:hypothetical protein
MLTFHHSHRKNFSLRAFTKKFHPACEIIHFAIPRDKISNFNQFPFEVKFNRLKGKHFSCCFFFESTTTKKNWNENIESLFTFLTYINQVENERERENKQKSLKRRKDLNNVMQKLFFCSFSFRFPTSK